MMGKGWYKGKNTGRAISVQTLPIRTVSPAPIDESERQPSFLGNVYLQYDNIQLRSQPGFSSSVIETISKSSLLQAITETNDWVQVRTPSGKDGWVARKWLK
jgi:N-acetylmuramoyl-L-alanine amidase